MIARDGTVASIRRANPSTADGPHYTLVGFSHFELADW